MPHSCCFSSLSLYPVPHLGFFILLHPSFPSVCLCFSRSELYNLERVSIARGSFKEPCAFSSIFAWLPGAHKREKSINSCLLTALPRAPRLRMKSLPCHADRHGAFMYRYQKEHHSGMLFGFRKRTGTDCIVYRSEMKRRKS